MSTAPTIDAVLSAALSSSCVFQLVTDGALGTRPFEAQPVGQEPSPPAYLYPNFRIAPECDDGLVVGKISRRMVGSRFRGAQVYPPIRSIATRFGIEFMAMKIGDDGRKLADQITVNRSPVREIINEIKRSTGCSKQCRRFCSNEVADRNGATNDGAEHSRAMQAKQESLTRAVINDVNGDVEFDVPLVGSYAFGFGWGGGGAAGLLGGYARPGGELGGACGRGGGPFLSDAHCGVSPMRGLQSFVRLRASRLGRVKTTEPPHHVSEPSSEAQQPQPGLPVDKGQRSRQPLRRSADRGVDRLLCQSLKHGSTIPHDATSNLHLVLEFVITLGSATKLCRALVRHNLRISGLFGSRLAVLVRLHHRALQGSATSLAGRRMRPWMLSVEGSRLELHVGEGARPDDQRHGDDGPVHGFATLLSRHVVRTVPTVENLNAVPEPQTDASEEQEDDRQNLKLLSVHGQSSLRNSRKARCASRCKPKAAKSKRPGPALNHVMLWLTPGTMIAAPRMANAIALSVVASSFTLSLFRFAASLRPMSSGVTSDLWFDAAT